MLFFVTIAVLLAISQGGRTIGEYRGSETWIYADRFCFDGVANDGTGSRFEAKFHFPKGSRPKLALYYLDKDADSEWGVWENVYSKPLVCGEKLNQSNMLIELVLQDKTQIEIAGEPWYSVSVIKKFTSARPRWMFFAIGNCDPLCTSGYCEQGLNIGWSFAHYNFDNSYYGYDKQVQYPVSVAFLVLYASLLVYGMLVRKALVGIRKMHVTIYILIWSIAFSMMQLASFVALSSSYSFDGVWIPMYSTCTMIFASISEMLLVLMLMLIMKGWTIVRRKISANGRMRMAIFLVIYMSVYWSCIFYFEYGIDTADIVYLFDTWPGYVLVVLRILLAIWIVRSYTIVMNKYNSKKGFYKKFTWFACGWCLSLPLYVLASLAASEYTRYSVVLPLQLSTNFMAHWIFMMLYSPNSMLCGKTFPFHATTTSMLQRTSISRSSLGNNSMKDIRLRQASEITRQIKHGINIFSSLSSDLGTFLEEIDPLVDELEHNDEDLPDASLARSSDIKSKRRNVVPPPKQNKNLSDMEAAIGKS